MSKENRREHKRLALEHRAQLLVGGVSYASCQVKNFSEGGLFLEIDAASLKKLKITSEDLTDNVLHAFVRLLDNQSGKELPYEIPVRLAFAAGSGFGVAFMNPSKEVIKYLAEQQSAQSIAKPKAEVRRVRAEYRDILDQSKQALMAHVNNHFPRFITCVSDALLEVSEQVPLQQQPSYTFASTALNQSADTVHQALIGQLEENWQQILMPVSEFSHSDTQTLELVGQEEFDEWAALMSIARRTEGRFSSTLHTLSQYLAYVIRVPISTERYPASPYAILWAFRKAIVALNLDASARDVVYQVFGEQVLVDLQSMYNQIHSAFERGGVTSDSISNQLFSGASGEDGDDPESTAPVRRRSKSLVDFLSFRGNRRDGAAARSEESRRTSTVTNAAIANALDDMVQGDTRSLVDRLEQALGGYAGEGGEISLPGESRQILDAAQQLLSSAQKDPRHNSLTRQLLKQVELPLVKAAIQDPDALNDPQAPSRKLLDNIDQLALLTPSTGGSAMIQQANAELRKVMASLEAAGGKADLKQVSKQISELLEKRKSDFENNISQVQTACSNDHQALEYIEEIRNFLRDALGDNVSGFVDQMLQFGWAGLLAESASRGELLSKHLESYKRALKIVQRIFQEKNRGVKLDEGKQKDLLKVLTVGFESYPIHKSQSVQLLEKFQRVLDGDRNFFAELNHPRIEVSDDYIDLLLPRAATDRKISETVSKKWMPLISKVQVGDWITNQLQHGQARLVNLVWVDPQRLRFVFVDGAGVRTLDCSRSELMVGLQSGEYSLIEDSGLPMVERAVDRVLRQTFERLREESDIDPITGLHNRRAYEREILRLQEIARDEKSMHIVMCIDVDNFSLVNDLYGFEGADHFLGCIANVCKSFMMKPGMLARTGDNEFSALVEHCGINEGYRIAESIRKAVENFRFEWGGKQVSVTVSIGLTEITSVTRTKDEISRAAHSACRQAKNEGHNSSRRFQLEGKEFAQQKRLVESVPLIEKAIEEDQLDLHAQLIAPIFIGDGHPDHHEILLRTLDEAGNPHSPFEFILAAEQFDRMRVVDRWVVERFFKWVETAIDGDDPSSLGVFSINLSGQSMTDQSFAEFLVGRINASSITPQQLAFEITETAMVTQIDKAIGLVEKLKKLGCSFFLDDFGSGYASYSYLKELPVDVVKIDGIFVKDIHQDDASYAMVKSITEVAHHLGKLVVAEYVENEPILSALTRLEVDFAQGYQIGKPAPLDKLVQQHIF